LADFDFLVFFAFPDFLECELEASGADLALRLDQNRPASALDDISAPSPMAKMQSNRMRRIRQLPDIIAEHKRGEKQILTKSGGAAGSKKNALSP
jgi:hypothetical protein